MNERELAILRVLAEGRTNAEIADELHLSVNTVKWYLQQIYQKLAVRNRVEAVDEARARGLLTPVSGQIGTEAALPTPKNTFWGRQQELGALTALLRRQDVRLISICGLGGSGKTRLAVEVGRQLQHLFPDGVCFFPLDVAQSKNEIWEQVRARLGCPLTPATPRRRLVLETVRNRQLLLIFDNVEHLPQFPAELNWLLARAHSCKALVTSRTALNLQAEHFFPIRGIAHQNGADSPAYRLFLETARRLNPDYTPTDGDQAEISALCDLVEGIPLALELAAAWTDVLSPARIAAQLRHDLARLELPAADRRERHRSLWVVFTYSWQLLSQAERQAAIALSSLSAPFTTEAALAIAQTTPVVLKALLRTSLIQPAGSGSLVIHELVRLFFEEQARLTGIDLDHSRDRAMTYYLTWLAETSIELRQTMSARCVQAITANWQHLLVAWERAVARDRWELLEACAEVAIYFEARGTWAEGDALFARTRQQVPAHCRTLRARLDEGRALFAFRTYDTRRAKHLADRALALLEEQDGYAESAGVYARITDSACAYVRSGFGAYLRLIRELEPLTMAHFGVYGRIMPLLFSATHYSAQGQHERSAEIFETIIASSPADGYHLPAVRCMLALSFQALGEEQRAREQFERALAIGRDIAVYPAQVAAVYELARMDSPQFESAQLRPVLQKMAHDVGGIAQLGRLLIHIGGHYVSLGFFTRARELFHLGLKLLWGQVTPTELAAQLRIAGKLMAYQLVIAGRQRKG